MKQFFKHLKADWDNYWEPYLEDFWIRPFRAHCSRAVRRLFLIGVLLTTHVLSGIVGGLMCLLFLQAGLMKPPTGATAIDAGIVHTGLQDPKLAQFVTDTIHDKRLDRLEKQLNARAE